MSRYGPPTLLLTLLCAGGLPGAVAMAGPMAFPVEGVLLSAAGGPAADGDYGLGFAFYVGPQAVAPLYTENLLAVAVKQGSFSATLGTADPTKQLDSSLFEQGQPLWLGVKVGGDPELPRVALREVPYAVRARRAQVATGLDCSGCVGAGQLGAGAVMAEHLAAGAVAAKHVAFGFAGSATKGGPAEAAVTAQVADMATSAKIADSAKSAKTADVATTAKGLDCTGCVPVAALAWDQDVDLGSRKLKADTVTAAKFVGDGSGLSGIKLTKGQCAPGMVVKNIGADGTVECTALFEGGKVAATLLPFEPGDLLAPGDRPLVSGLGSYSTDHFAIGGLGIGGASAKNVKAGVSFGPGGTIQGTYKLPPVPAGWGGHCIYQTGDIACPDASYTKHAREVCTKYGVTGGGAKATIQSCYGCQSTKGSVNCNGNQQSCSVECTGAGCSTSACAFWGSIAYCPACVAQHIAGTGSCEAATLYTYCCAQ